MPCHTLALLLWLRPLRWIMCLLSLCRSRTLPSSRRAHSDEGNELDDHRKALWKGMPPPPDKITPDTTGRQVGARSAKCFAAAMHSTEASWLAGPRTVD